MMISPSAEGAENIGGRYRMTIVCWLPAITLIVSSRRLMCGLADQP
jgi:hypothetical protein